MLSQATIDLFSRWSGGVCGGGGLTNLTLAKTIRVSCFDKFPHLALKHTYQYTFNTEGKIYQNWYIKKEKPKKTVATFPKFCL